MTGTDAREVPRPAAGGRGNSAPCAPARRAAFALSVVGLAAMVTAAVAGLAMDGAYGRPESVAAMLRGYDLVTLVVAAPLLTWALLRVRQGATSAEPVWVGVLAYGVYDYAIYLFGTGFNDLFLLHVATFAAFVFAVPPALATLRAPATLGEATGRTSARAVSAVLAVLAVALGAMWIAASLRFALTGELPAGSALVETDTLVHAGIALDLALLVPAYALAAVLLWRRTGWGYVAAAVVLVSGTLHQVAYLVALPFQAAADVPGAHAVDPGELPVALAFLLATAAVVAGLRRADQAPTAAPR